MPLSLPNQYELSKSTYLRGKQCELSLYLKKNCPDLKMELDDAVKSRLARGKEIVELGKQLFPNGIDIHAINKNWQQQLVATQENLSNKTKVIYNAVFYYNGVLIKIDVLTHKNKELFAYQIKGATKISPHHYQDAALQYHVAQNSGSFIQNFYIVNINKKYRREETIAINELFKITDITTSLTDLQQEEEKQIQTFKKILSLSAPPEIKIGGQCHTPNPCNFINYCWKNIAKNSVFDLTGMSKVEQFELYNDGITEVKNVPFSRRLSKDQIIQISAEQTGQNSINKKEIKKFINELKFPLLFADFESFQTGIPIYKGQQPYQQIPFQYSVHTLNSLNASLQHVEFIADVNHNPTEKFITNFLKATQGNGTILVYNQLFEKMILKQMKKLYPHLANEIRNRIARIKDLMLIFKKKQYYSPKMKGSFSLKYVLPALIPELSYEKFTINNGFLASNAYQELLHETDAKKIKQTKTNLLLYCKMDTYAMVKIVEKLRAVI